MPFPCFRRRAFLLITPKGEDLPFGIEDNVTDPVVADQKDENSLARISSNSVSIFPTSEEVLQDLPRLATRPQRSYQSRVHRLRVVVKVRLQELSSHNYHLSDDHHATIMPPYLYFYPACRSNICTLRM